MVLKEVAIDFMTIYICVSIVREKSINYSLFTSPTLYWVSTNPGRDSVCMSLCVLAGFPKFFVDFLVLGVCGHFLTVSSVGAGAGAGPSAAGVSSTVSAISAFSSFLSEKIQN